MPHNETTNSLEFDLQDHIDQFENFLSVTEMARLAAERDRDYVDHKQWDDAEVTTLENRGQAPVVINKIKTKVNTLTGVQRQQRRDPKALPRTPKHEEAADSATDAIRFVADNEDLQVKSSNTFERELVWGYGACIVEVEERGDQIEVAINEIHSDRYYYDPFSRQKDFSDKKFDGIVIWSDVDDAIALFPDKKDEIESALSTTTDSVDGHTYEDKPLWVDRERKRIRICQHYFKQGGDWYLTYFTGDSYLLEPKLSPYLDEDGEPSNPIEAQTAYIDRENDRYGEVRSYIWSQDEINHRRSKLLYQLSVRQTMGEKGAVEDVDLMKRQLAKPDGHVEVNPNFELEILQNQDQIAGQMLLYQESKGEIDAAGANAALSGDVDGLSGRAIQSLQQGGIAELGSLFDGHSHWEKRIYRQIWNRIKQFWDAERWIRVTDDEDALKWVGLNQPMTKGQVLQEQAEDGNEMAAQFLQNNLNDPRLNEVAEIRNNVAELDVDILLEQTTDFATLRHEQFDILARLAQAYGPQEVPFETMLGLSEFPHKEDFKKEQETVDAPQQQAQAEIQSMFVKEDLRKATLDNDKTETEILENEADIRQKEVETVQLASAPASAVNVSV